MITDKPERPVCTECECFHLRRDLKTVGWIAVCTAKTSHGRMMDSQYGLSWKFTRAELLDRVEIRICPNWCMKWRK